MIGASRGSGWTERHGEAGNMTRTAKTEVSLCVCVAAAFLFAQLSQARITTVHSIRAHGGKDDYSVEQLAPGVLRVIGHRLSKERVYIGRALALYSYSYRASLAKALREIGKNWVIEQVTPITVKLNRGAVTKELILVVEPRI